jgi:hypothetical protein
MQKNKCPLCGRKRITIIQKIDIKNIAKLYRAHFGYDIERLDPPKFISFNHCDNCDLEYFWPAFVADSGFFSYFEKYPWYYMKKKPEFDVASKYIHKKDSVLEIDLARVILQRK